MERVSIPHHIPFIVTLSDMFFTLALFFQELGKLAPELTDAIGYIDFIPRFRGVGERCLGDHVEAQKRTLRELVAAVHIQAGEEEEEGQEGGPGGFDGGGAGGEWLFILLSHVES